MRKILFRAKNKRTGWVQGAYIEHINRQVSPIGDELHPEDVEHYIAVDSFADWNMPRSIQLIPIDPETVGEYTGFDDMTKRWIFEGDILKIPCSLGDLPEDNFEAIVEVVWSQDDGGWMVRERPGMEDIMDKCCVEEARVIGNIWDNPELMEVQNETTDK